MNGIIYTPIRVWRNWIWYRYWEVQLSNHPTLSEELMLDMFHQSNCVFAELLSSSSKVLQYWDEDKLKLSKFTHCDLKAEEFDVFPPLKEA